MPLRNLFVLFLSAILFTAVTQADIYDECNDFQYVHDHSVDMVVDYREPTYYNYDNGRFKRDMQSPVGFSKATLRLTFCIYGNYAPELDRRFYVYSDYKNESTKIQLTTFNESQNVVITEPTTGTQAYYYRDYEIPLPENSYFFEIHFLDWVKGPAGINYWTPQINFVKLKETCDPKCGNGICGEVDLANRTENCETCPQDCGECPTPVCGNGICELGENWPSPTAEYSTDLGPLTCYQDCGFISVCGNGRCDSGEVCRSDNTHSCSADCCEKGNYTINPGFCSNGFCDGNETCETCAQDCGVCPSCGDGVCNGADTCQTCPSDCGPCPVTRSCPNLPSQNTTTGVATTGSVGTTGASTTGAEPSPSSEPSPVPTPSASPPPVDSTTTDAISDDFPSEVSSEEEPTKTLIIVVITTICGSLMLGAAVALCLMCQRKRRKLRPIVETGEKYKEKEKEEKENQDMKSITCSRRSSEEAFGQS